MVPPVAPLNYQEWRQRQTVFDALGAYRFGAFALSNVENPEQLLSLELSSSMFRVLRADAAVGRVFTEDEQRRHERVVVLTHEFWQRRFGTDPAIVGRSITLDGAAFTVVGVMPPGFSFPDGNPVDVYAPLVFTRDELSGRRSHSLTVLGRLTENASIDTARVELGAIAGRIAAEDVTSNPEVTLVGAHEALVEDVRLGLVVLSGTVGCVLLIACANVASLLLVRATSRRREIAMRAALGAGRGRLVRQLLTESVRLSHAGGAAGTVLTWWLLRAFVQFRPPDLPRLDALRVDTTVLLFALAATVLTGIVFGIIPALQAARPRLTDATRPTADAAPAPNRVRWALVIMEVALSLVLLAGAGLMGRSFFELRRLDLGLTPEHVLTAQIQLAPSTYPIDPVQYRALRSGSGRRFTALLLAGFAAVALALALVGVYGVTAYVVNQRTREIAVRVALGAQRREVIRMIARETMGYAVAGIVIGLAGAIASTQFMSGLVFGVTATDPLTFASASTPLFIAAVAAACIPAVRAARVVPVTVPAFELIADSPIADSREPIADSR